VTDPTRGPERDAPLVVPSQTGIADSRFPLEQHGGIRAVFQNLAAQFWYPFGCSAAERAGAPLENGPAASHFGYGVMIESSTERVRSAVFPQVNSLARSRPAARIRCRSSGDVASAVIASAIESAWSGSM
jgi:hypothetical protein